MHICVVGGIFDKSLAYRAHHAISPETVLVDGLRRKGWRVTAAGHSTPLEAADFDLVHVHHFGRTALRLAAITRRPPFVLTTHDPFAMNGLYAGWKRSLTDQFILRRADTVVALSNAERDFLIRRRRLRHSRITVIPNGIDAVLFSRTAASALTKYDLLFAGQLYEFKGLDYLLRAMPAVRSCFPAVRLKVVYQTAALLNHYHALVAQLDLEGCVEFAGSRTAAGLAQLYSSATVVVSPSLGECLSTVVLEAMCCGAAVVATDVGGIREQLDEDAGIIVPPRDSTALARAICGLLADPGWRARLGQAARIKARSQFNVPLMIDRHIHLYETLLETHARAA